MPSLTDDESVLFLKVVRNCESNNVERLLFTQDKIVIHFTNGYPDPQEIQREVALSWKDKEWQEFFKKNEPLL